MPHNILTHLDMTWLDPPYKHDPTRLQVCFCWPRHTPMSHVSCQQGHHQFPPVPTPLRTVHAFCRPCRPCTEVLYGTTCYQSAPALNLNTDGTIAHRHGITCQSYTACMSLCLVCSLRFSSSIGCEEITGQLYLLACLECWQTTVWAACTAEGIAQTAIPTGRHRVV